MDYNYNQDNNYIQDSNQSTHYQANYVPAMPMKWHKFLIYFALWLSALSAVGNALMFFNGSHYGSDLNREMVYMVFDNMKSLDSFMGIIFLALAAFALITRFALAGYKRTGPKFILILYGANAAVTLLYPLLASSLTDLPFSDMVDTSTVTSIIVGVIMIFANKTYYDNRAHLFVN